VTVRVSFQEKNPNGGSILIMVLWALVLISFLAGEYLDSNRGKASLAVCAWDSVRQNEAIESAIHFFATDFWPIPGQIEKNGNWMDLSPGKIDLWVKTENESGRTNINTAAEAQVREKIREVLGQEREEEADQLADAILDWRDRDILVRVNGCEADDYHSQGVTYTPSDGPFKVLNELLLVRGMTHGLFWGDPMKGISNEEDETQTPVLSIFDAFTIYPEDTKRVSVVVPGKGNSYTLVIAFLEKKTGRWDVLQRYQTTLMTSDRETDTLGQEETDLELS